MVHRCFVMSQDDLPISRLRHALVKGQFSGVPLPSTSSLAELYATVVSSEDALEGANEWAMVSYVHTNSPICRNGMPAWVAEDAEGVLDALVEEGIIREKAVWFDRVGMRQTDEWTALATLHNIAVPVICVPPARSKEYSRYYRPDKWDLPSFGFQIKVERVLQGCRVCSRTCPMEFDTRLLNIAALFRSWPEVEASIASAASGAYISFASMDRFAYTIAWYQTLLQIALDLAGFGDDLYSKSVELYGKPLLRPCSSCMQTIRQMMFDEETLTDYHIFSQLLDDALASLVVQVNRFALPRASEKEGMNVWSLESHRVPGEGNYSRMNNRARLREFSRKRISQNSFQEIAANICRGSPSLMPCYRQGDKWHSALILSNINSFLNIMEDDNETDTPFSDRHRSNTLELLKTDRPFSDYNFRDSRLEMELNTGIRSPVCNGKDGSICLFNHLSGLLAPESVGQFLRDRNFDQNQISQLLAACERSYCTRIGTDGIALPCYEYKNGALKDYSSGSCGACRKNIYGEEEKVFKMYLVGWKAKDQETEEPATSFDRMQKDAVYCFIAVDADDAESCHVRMRGTFSRSNPSLCRRCKSQYIRIEVQLESQVDITNDWLEIHVNRLLPVASTLRTIFDAMRRCHEL